MDWLDHDRLGFNYRLSDIAAAIGVEQVKRLPDLLDARATAAALYNEALGDTAVTIPAPGSRSWFVYVVQLPAEVDRDATMAKLGAMGIETKPYLPAIHLMSFYRERFGWREGQFPVCEDVSRRSLALPFFPGITEAQVARVAEALAQLLPR
jgi:perosamine synthetase